MPASAPAPPFRSHAPKIIMKRLLPLVCLTTLLAADSVFADRVLTEDGRMITPLKAREHGEGYKLTFEHGEILLTSKAGIASVEIEGDMSDYVPKDEKEAKFLEEGRIKYRGKWWSKPAYESELKKEAERSKERTEALAAHAVFDNPWTKKPSTSSSRRTRRPSSSTTTASCSKPTTS